MVRLSRLRFCVPEARRAGGGLGNELFPWAKAYIASQELSLTVLQPAWGVNPRRYGTYFQRFGLDWMVNRALPRMLPSWRFAEADYRSTGFEDFGEAISTWAQRESIPGEGAAVVVVEGMWGGFISIRRARDFVLSRLLTARGTLDNLYRLRRQIDDERVLVAVHVRLGDFSRFSPDTNLCGRFDVSLPLDWFIAVGRSIKRLLANRVVFLVVTDGSREQVRPLVQELQALTSIDLPSNVCSDLMMLAQADLLVCSPSSFSMWGAFLSRGPYIWFAHQLQMDGDFFSLWGHEPAQRPPYGLTARNRQIVQQEPIHEVARGIPVGADGLVPEKVLEDLDRQRLMRLRARDLLMHGVVRAQGTPTARVA